MYNSLRRRGGSNRPADARARQVPADRHEGSYRDFLRRHECESADAARSTGRKRTEFAGCLFRRAADSRNLRCAIDHLAAEGGRSPGPNGLTLDELDGRSDGSWPGHSARRSGPRRYRPGPHREVEIPKGPGRGMRTLRIRNVEDRVVERAIVQVVQPFLDPMFAAGSFGYRPGRGREHALAYAEAKADANGSWVWVLDDVKDAFDHVPLARLLDVVRNRLVAGDIVELIRVVTDHGATRGIRQGSSLSPLLLNVYLDHVLDRPWARREPATPLIRVADDLLVLARDRADAGIARGHLRDRLLSAGMMLKANPEAAVAGSPLRGDRRLAGVPAPARGRPASRSGRRRRAGRSSTSIWAWPTRSRPPRSVPTRSSWAGPSRLGPCRPNLDIAGTYARIASLAREHAFDEIPPLWAIEDRLLHGYRRWESLRGRARRSPMERDTAAPPARV